MSEKTIEANFAEIDILAYRGDTFNKLLFILRDIEDDGNDNKIETPSNMDGFQFSMQVRADPNAENFLAEFNNDRFYLGQSDEAIQYDIDEGNPEGTTKDELHINVPSTEMLFVSGNWYYDLEFKDLSGDIKTPIKGRFRLIQDVTREITYN